MTFQHIKYFVIEKYIDISSSHDEPSVKSRHIFACCALVAMLALSLVFTSCGNLFSTDPVTPPKPQEPEPRDTVVVLNGRIAIDESRLDPQFLDYFASNTNYESRSAVPESLIFEECSYSIWATGTTSSGTVTVRGSVDGSEKTFSIPLTLNYEWTINLEVTAQDTNAPEASSNPVLKATYEFGHPLEQIDVTQPLELILEPLTDYDGYINLEITKEQDADSYTFDIIEVTVSPEPEGNVVIEPVFDEEYGRWNITTSSENGRIKSGTYEFTIDFFSYINPEDPVEGKVLVYSTVQTINVFDYMNTCRWMDSGNSSSPINGDGLFVVTEDLKRLFLRTNFYVAGDNGDDTNEGSYYSPLKTISEAIRRIDATEPTDGGEAYTIRLMNYVEGGVVIPSTLSNNENNTKKASSITIKLAPGVEYAGVKGKKLVRVFEINTSIPVIISDIEISDGRALTGESPEEKSGGGLYVSSGSKVTLNNCTIKGNSAKNGGGIYTMSGSNGSVTLNNCTITGNSAEENGGGIYRVYYADLTLNNCTISNNSAGGNGGAIYIDSAGYYNIKLNGVTSIPAGKNNKNDIYFCDNFKSLEIGEGFFWSGKNGSLTCNAYTIGDTLLSGFTEKAYNKFDFASQYYYGVAENGKIFLKNPVVCVSSSLSSPAGNDTDGDGSLSHPFATVNKALEKIQGFNTAADYVIKISGEIDVDGSLTISSSTFGTFTGSTLTIQGTDKATDKLVSSEATANNNASLISIECSQSVTLKNLTLSGREMPENEYEMSNGGGVYAASGTNVTLTDCSVTSCTASGSGGGVYNNGGSLTLDHCEVTDCTSHHGGGGVFNNSGTLTLADCTIKSNTAQHGGGGVYNADTLNISGNTDITINSSVTENRYNNVYLDAGKYITINAALADTSRIGVTTDINAPPAYGTPVRFTSGLSGRLAADKTSDVFTSDAGYAVVTGTGTDAGEAFLSASGGTITDQFSKKITAEITCAQLSVTNGSTLNVSAVFKKPGTETGTTVDLDPQPTPDKLTWRLTLMSGGHRVPGVNVSETSSLHVPVNAKILSGNQYVLHAQVTYDGISYDKDIPLTPFVYVEGATISGAVSGSKVFVSGRTVSIPSLLVSDHEVTQGEYMAVMGTNPSHFNGSEGMEPASGEVQMNRPVEYVSWYNAIAYCNKMSIKNGLTPCYTIDGMDNTAWENLKYSAIPTSGNSAWNAVKCDFTANGYRLPTEAEWEYIARGGDGLTGTQYTFSGSNTAVDVGWFSENASSKTHEVKQMAPNGLGIYDMSGNVWEWCWDRYNSNEPISSSTPASGISSGTYRICRGGSWRWGSVKDSVTFTVSYRDNANPTNASYSASGIRVVRTARYSFHSTVMMLPAGTEGTAGTTGSYALFGDWPQTIKEESVVITSTTITQGGFTYYLGDDYNFYAKVTENAAGTDYSYSDGTPVAQGGTSEKYFKVEPIKWRVINESYDHDGNSDTAGKKLLLAENLMTGNVPYYMNTSERTINGITVKPNNYKYSTVRAWLNGSYESGDTQTAAYSNKGFLQSAFTSAARSLIATTTVVNNLASTGFESNPNICDDTEDKVFLLSYSEVFGTTTAFANNASRIRKTTDYAKANNAFQSNIENSGGSWTLRSPFMDSISHSRYVRYAGDYDNYSVDIAVCGIVPAICVN